MYAHVSGLPLEETALGLMPVAAVSAAAVISRMGQVKRALRFLRPGHEEPRR